jgi:hypothetical protein
MGWILQFFTVRVTCFVVGMVARQPSRISGEAAFLYVFLKQIVRMSVTESFDDGSCLEATMHLNIAGALVVLGKDKPLLRQASCNLHGLGQENSGP